jgi:hypothetical protein
MASYITLPSAIYTNKKETEKDILGNVNNTE